MANRSTRRIRNRRWYAIENFTVTVTVTVNLTPSTDHLKIKVLNYTAQTHPTTQKLHAIQPSNPSDRVLRTNEFPYSTAPEGEITHYVLWSLNEMTEKDVETTLIEQLPEHEFIHFVNPPHRKTVPEIHHWHVFARRIKRN